MAKVWAAMQKRGCKDRLTVGEWFVFLGLMCAATLYIEDGRELWRTKKKKSLFGNSPSFAEYMTCERFEDIKACAVAGCTDLSQHGTEKWFKFKPAVDAVNKRRQEVVVISEVLTPDGRDHEPHLPSVNLAWSRRGKASPLLVCTAQARATRDRVQDRLRWSFGGYVVHGNTGESRGHGPQAISNRPRWLGGELGVRDAPCTRGYWSIVRVRERATRLAEAPALVVEQQQPRPYHY